MLCHNPNGARTMTQYNVPIHLQLSGHTHGGQVNVMWPNSKTSKWERTPVISIISKMFSKVSFYCTSEMYLAEKIFIFLHIILYV